MASDLLLYSQATGSRRLPPPLPSTTTTTPTFTRPTFFAPRRVFRAYALKMLINPAAIVAFLVYLIAGPLAISQRFQTRFKSLGHGVHQKISSVLSLPYTSLEPQDYSVALETTIVQALPIAPVETNVVHPVEILPSCPVPLEDHDEIVFPEVCSTRYDDRPSPDPVRAFVVASEYHGPFDWRDLFDHRVLYLLIMVYVSICFPLVVIPLVFKLLPRSESSNKAMGLANAQRTPLPPKVLTTPPTVHIRLPHALPEPTFPPAPPEPSAFWFVCEYPPVCPTPTAT